MDYKLIEISDEEESICTESEGLNDKIVAPRMPSNISDFEDNNIDGYVEITLVKSHKPVITDTKIKQFISFCKRKKLFDDTFYDYSNIFSVIATKLPDTFEVMSEDGNEIEKDRFITVFRKNYKYKGDIKYIYNVIDKEAKGFITWDDFKEFFLPFVQNVTM